jgi:hypothetical protein
MRVLAKTEAEHVAGAVARGSETALRLTMRAQARRSGTSIDVVESAVNKARWYYGKPRSERWTLDPASWNDQAIVVGRDLMRKAGWIVY